MSHKIERLIALKELYVAAFDRAWAVDDGEEMERQLVRMRASTKVLLSLVER